MPARRCSTCGINYPVDYRFQQCPIHKEGTDFFQGLEVDEDWEQRALRLREHLALQALDAELIPVVETTVRLRDGNYWIHAWDVIDSGVRHRLNEGELIQVGKQTFEVLAYVEAQREYLVEPFSLELSDEDLRKLADGVV